MIINKDVEDILKQIPGTLYGQALSILLEQWEEETKDVRTCKTVEEMEGRKIALQLIKDLFKFMDSRKVETKNKNQYI